MLYDTAQPAQRIFVPPHSRCTERLGVCKSGLPVRLGQGLCRSPKHALLEDQPPSSPEGSASDANCFGGLEKMEWRKQRGCDEPFVSGYHCADSIVEDCDAKENYQRAKKERPEYEQASLVEIGSSRAQAPLQGKDASIENRPGDETHGRRASTAGAQAWVRAGTPEVKEEL
jgi:hypothetical protein